MDRALSFFGVYDVFGYLASGTSAVVGIWWLVAGSLPHFSTVGILGLLGGSYIAGQVAATLGHLWEELWWQRKGGKPYMRMLGEDGYEFEEPLRAAIASLVDREVASLVDGEAGVSSLSDKQRFDLARTKLRRENFEGRAETMRAMHGLCRNLTATAGVLFLVAVVVWVVQIDETRLWIVAALSLLAIFAFGWRTLRFERRFGRAVWMGYLALQMSARPD